MILNNRWRRRKGAAKGRQNQSGPSAEALENRYLLSNNSVFSFQAPQPIVLATDDAESYTTLADGSNGGTGLGPVVVTDQGPGSSLFLETGADLINGSQSFGMAGGNGGIAFSRQILAPTHQAEYTLTAEFDEDNTNGFDGFSIKSAQGSKFGDNELLSFGLSKATGDFSIVVNGSSTQTIDLAFTPLTPSTTTPTPQKVDFDLVYDTDAGTYTLGAKLSGSTVFTTATGSLKIVGQTATTLGFAAFNEGLNQKMVFDDLHLQTVPTTNSVSEGAQVAQVFVTRTGDNVSTSFTVTYTTVDGTAKAGIDYVETSGTLTFDQNDATPQVINIPIIDNHRIDGDREFQVFLTNVTPAGTQPNPVTLDQTPATVTIQDNDTGFEFTNAAYSFPNDQTAVLTVQRVGDLRGSASVDFATLAGTGATGAKAGTDYGTAGNAAEVSGTLNFADGQTIVTVSVPLINNSFTGDKTFSVVLSNATTNEPGDEAFATGASTAMVTITSKDVTPPTVTNVELLGTKSQIKSVRLTFSEELRQLTAQSTSSYGLFAVRNDSRNGTGARSRINLKFAAYDASAHTVTLVPARPLGAGQNYQLVVFKGGIMDLSLNQIHGDPNNPTQANNYSTYFARGTALTYTDHNGDRVKLNLRKGGFMDLFRNNQGDATLVALQQTVSGSSVLNGNIVRQGPDTDGVTTIASLTGTTGVQDLLHNPPFSITSIS